MRENIKNRLDELETSSLDWVAKLDTVDFDWVLDDYSNKRRWKELWHDDGITVFKNVVTGEIRGAYWDRRTHAQIEEMGGDLAYL